MRWDFHFVFDLSYSFKFSIFGLVLRMTKKPILWRHQLWRHKNEIWDFKSDKFFTFMCTIFLQSITLSGLILLEEKSLGVLIF